MKNRGFLLVVLLLCLSVSGCFSPIIHDISSSEAGSIEQFVSEAASDADGRFDCVYGDAVFYVPDGFEQIAHNDRPAAGYWYSFRNSDLDALIEVSETAAGSLPVDVDTALDDAYAHMSSAPGVTYCDSGDGWCVASGYNSDETQIYYTKYLRGGDQFLYLFTMTYPTANKNICDPIVTEFERTFCR